MGFIRQLCSDSPYDHYQVFYTAKMSYSSMSMVPTLSFEPLIKSLCHHQIIMPLVMVLTIVANLSRVLIENLWTCNELQQLSGTSDPHHLLHRHCTCIGFYCVMGVPTFDRAL
jgi:hypothetical protein